MFRDEDRRGYGQDVPGPDEYEKKTLNERKGRPYHEELIQWIWEELRFECRSLSTVCGKRLEISDPGVKNQGHGPDFFRASVVIDGLQWHGAVEVHNRAGLWREHHHHKDPEYNRVILHVVYEDEGNPAITQDGFRPYVLELKPYLSRPLHVLLREKGKGSFPCAGAWTARKQKAFEEQIRKSHEEYFSYKTEQLLGYYPAGQVPSIAWRHCLIKAVYDTLGIPGNREAMRELADEALKLRNLPEDKFVDAVYDLAFGKHAKIFGWRYSGMRPAGRPQVRVRQAAALHIRLNRFPMAQFLKLGVRAWHKNLETIPETEQIGKERREILRKTVFLPAVYLLGDLFAVKRLQHEAQSEWLSAGPLVPGTIQKAFRKAGFRVGSAVNCDGMIHQYKRYCRTGRCIRCKVFKSAIHS